MMPSWSTLLSASESDKSLSCVKRSSVIIIVPFVLILLPEKLRYWMPVHSWRASAMICAPVLFSLLPWRLRLSRRGERLSKSPKYRAPVSVISLYLKSMSSMKIAKGSKAAHSAIKASSVTRLLKFNLSFPCIMISKASFSSYVSSKYLMKALWGCIPSCSHFR